MTQHEMIATVKQKFKHMSKNELVRACTDLFFELEILKYENKQKLKDDLKTNELEKKEG